ncbi:MAG TPA: hypothetical protein DEO54_00745 [Rikenellaceae bacterium]|nr:hypothetical protein [Rikenellaceae bacterium]
MNSYFCFMHTDKSKLTEKELLQEVAGGDAESFKYLFDKYKNKIYSMSMYITHSEYVSEEITQEVFYKVWQHKAELGKIEFFNSYLRTIVTNVAYNYLKRLANEKFILKSLSRESAESSNSTEHTVLFNDYQAILEQAIQKLPPQQKRVYILSRQEGLKQEEIAKKMNISIHTVKEHMKSAITSVRKFVDNKIQYSIIAAAQIFFNN